jgi:molecular chaperone DnaJ
MPKDYYSILGVKKGATEDDIKKSFRRLAHEHHPDKGGDPAKFKDINEAYQVLSDGKKRQTYDQFGSAAFEQGGPSGAPGGFGGFDFQGQDFGDLGDILGEMFGFGGPRGGGGRSRPRGEDIQMDVELSFHDAAFGVQRSIRLYKHTTCNVCAGSGAEKGTKMASCKTCSGSGQTKQAQRTLFGVFQTVVACTDCHGTGEKPEQACKHCKGSGVERREETLTIPIPAGIASDQVLRVEGAGETAAYGGGTGDLFVRVRVLSDKRFVREGHDVLTQLEVPFSVLALGGDVEVETLDGKTNLSVPDGTPSGTVLILKGKGIPFPRGGRGDQRVRVTPSVPKHPNREQRRALEDLKSNGL